MHVGRRFSRGKTILAIGVISAVIGGSIFAYWFFAVRDTGPIPRKYSHGLDITLYYPTRLPNGYTVDRNSFERKDEVLIFSINAPKGRNIAVSQQAVPPDIPTRTKNPAPIPLPGQKEFTTAIGQAYISLWGDKYVSDILTPSGTWVILNTTGFTTDEATAVTQSFTELQ